MDAALLTILRCPFCRASLSSGGERLECTSCKRTYAVEDGIPLMLHEELPGAPEKLGEMAGWVEKARAEGWYEPDDATDSHLPYLQRDLGWEDQSWIANEVSFDVLLNEFVDGRRDLRVLEVGAAKAWAAPYWRERGCEYVATDILVDRNIGLGRGAFYGDFARVQADGERLPFADGTFDIAYCVAALHHALDMRAMVGEMSRVTRRGGIVAALNEGTRGVFRSGENPEQQAEKALGINEHVHTVWAYIAVFLRAGLRIVRLDRADGRPAESPGAKLVRIPLAGPKLAMLAHLSHKPYGGLTMFSKKR